MLFGFREGFFECCNPLSKGEPEFLTDEHNVSLRSPANLFQSASGDLQLYFQRWQSDRHDHARAVVVAHHGEADHCGWFNALAVRLTSIGCLTYALDAQGFGQSDGARGYFESFDDLVNDYVEFVKLKWAEVHSMHSRARTAGLASPGLVLVGKGFGALVVMKALIELHPLVTAWGVTPSVVLISPGFQFTSYVGDRTDIACGLNRGQCGRQPTAQCARMPAAAVLGPGGDETSSDKLEQMSHWFPKMIITKPVDPDMLSRDPEAAERMNRDALCWQQGYRARVLAEISREQADLADSMVDRAEVFERCPALIMQGGGDRLFAVHGSHNVHRTWCDLAQRSGVYPRLKIYDGAFHQLLNEPNKDEIVNDIMLFVASKACAA